MDIVTIIRRYITKHYDVSIEEHIMIKGIHTNDAYTLSSFMSDTTEIFNYNSHEVCVEWYEARLRQKIKSIYRYLDNYRVVQGSSMWKVLDKDKNELKIRDMVKNFDGVYDEKFIRKIQNDWYLEKIIKNTEKILENKD